MSTFSIRHAHPEEYGRLAAIEEQADEIYRSLPGFEGLLEEVGIVRANSAGGPDEKYKLVADENGQLVGMSVCDPVDDCLYLAQLSVVPDSQGKGVGTRLVQESLVLARSEGYRGLMLCTFGNVPWNQPFYEKCGFDVVAPSTCGPTFAAKATRDAARWGSYGPRVAMGRFFDGARSAKDPLSDDE